MCKSQKNISKFNKYDQVNSNNNSKANNKAMNKTVSAAVDSALSQLAESDNKYYGEWKKNPSQSSYINSDKKVRLKSILNKSK